MLLQLSVLILAGAWLAQGVIVEMSGEGPDVVISPRPTDYLHRIDIPASYDIRNLSGVNYASPIRSQMVPQFCGSCWAFAATSSLNDRLKLMRQNAFPDYVLAPQALLNCANGALSLDDASRSPLTPSLVPGLAACNGGSAFRAFEYIHRNGIPDETCAPYVAAAQGCQLTSRCQFCDDGNIGCFPVRKYRKFNVTEYGRLHPNGSTPSMVQQMMSEIAARGPIACNVFTDNEFDLKYTGGVMMPRKSGATNHVVTVSGWGAETLANGTTVPYWIVRNSYGTWWGEDGWFRIFRGANALGIESACAWAVPAPADL